MPNRWDIPVGEVPDNAPALLEEAGRLLAHDLEQTARGPLSVTVALDADGDSYIELSGNGLLIPMWVLPDDVQAKTTVSVAEAILNSAFFDEYVTPWPACPDHPESTHSLLPIARGTQAAWICPQSKRTMALIGSLPEEL